MKTYWIFERKYLSHSVPSGLMNYLYEEEEEEIKRGGRKRSSEDGNIGSQERDGSTSRAGLRRG